METIHEFTGWEYNDWRVEIKASHNGLVRLQLVGPRGGDKGFVDVLKEDLINAIEKEVARW